MADRTFLTKDVFKNLAGCISIVEALTETFKLLCGDLIHPYILWAVFVFSVYVGIARFLMLEKHSKEALIMAGFNIIIIFLGSVGVYQVGIKQLGKIGQQSFIQVS